MAKIATIDWFERWGTSVFSENTAIFKTVFELGSWSFRQFVKCK